MRPLVLLLSLVLSGCAAALSSPSSGTDERCAAAVAYAEFVLKEAADHKHHVVFSTDDVNQRFALDPVEWVREPLDFSEAAISGPPPALQRVLASGGGRSAVRECASVRALLQARGAGFGATAVAAAMAPEPGAARIPFSTPDEPLYPYRARITRFTLPVIARNGREAILSAEDTSDPSDGSGSLYYLQRTRAGAWKVVGSALIWRAG